MEKKEKKEKEETGRPRAICGQQYVLCMIVNWSERKQGSGPKGDEVL